jgi:beta-phosphoglucomutase-like phosphatase (HAD superfamily)
LKGYFETLLTVDTVKQFKPAPDVYREAARSLKINTTDICMVAAHSWDVSGAMQAGCSAAFVARQGMVLDPLLPKPEIVGRDPQLFGHQRGSRTNRISKFSVSSWSRSLGFFGSSTKPRA